MSVRRSSEVFRGALREPRIMFWRSETRSALFAGSGLVAALAASACCVLPLALGTIGLGGAWVSTLTVLAPYQTVIRILAILLLGAGFWLVYAPRVRAGDAAACSVVPSRRLTKTLLWAGLLLMVVVLSSEWWVPLVV